MDAHWTFHATGSGRANQNPHATARMASLGKEILIVARDTQCCAFFYFTEGDPLTEGYPR